MIFINGFPRSCVGTRNRFGEKKGRGRSHAEAWERSAISIQMRLPCLQRREGLQDDRTLLVDTIQNYIP